MSLERGDPEGPFYLKAPPRDSHSSHLGPLNLKIVLSNKINQFLKKKNSPAISLEEKHPILGLTKASRAVRGHAVFLIVLTLVGFQAVPVGMFVFTGVAKQGGSWKKHPRHRLVVPSNCLLGKNGAKSLGKYKGKSLV